jgi:hypothetical protein
MIGVTYYVVVRLPGLTSSFVAILGALIAFDVYVALEHRRYTAVGLLRALALTWPRALGTAASLAKGLGVGFAFGLLHLVGLPYALSAVATAGIAYTLGEQTPANTSVYVGLIGGLTVFESVARLRGVALGGVWRAVYPLAFHAIFVTSLALGIGLLIGTVSGIITRLFLPRAFRSRRIEAYPYPGSEPVRVTRLAVEVGGQTPAHIPAQAPAQRPEEELTKPDRRDETPAD